MLLEMNPAQIARLREYVAASEDCEELGEDEYDVALDDETEMEIALTPKGVEILAVVRLQYDEELKGWYIAEQIADKAEMLRKAKTWTPLKEVSTR